MTSPIVCTSRRKFLQYLAASPLVASGAIDVCGMEAPAKLPDPMIWGLADRELIKSPKDAINVFDFEPVARKNVPPAHFGYMRTISAWRSNDKRLISPVPGSNGGRPDRNTKPPARVTG